MSLLHIDMTRVVETILHSLYHGCGCACDARSQGISNHDVYCVEAHWVGPRTLGVNFAIADKSNYKETVKAMNTG